MEGVPDLAGVAGDTRKRGNLPVCSHAPPGDSPDHIIDPLMGHNAQGSGAPLHAGRQESYSGDEGNASSPGGNGLL